MGYLHVISVDDGTGDVGEQADELLLEATHAVGDLINDDLDPLVIPQDVDANDGCVIVTCQVPGHNVHYKVARAVGHEEIEGAQDAVHTPCRESPGVVNFFWRILSFYLNMLHIKTQLGQVWDSAVPCWDAIEHF